MIYSVQAEKPLYVKQERLPTNGKLTAQRYKSCIYEQLYRYTAVSKYSLTDPVLCFAACSLWQGQCENIRSKDNLFARMPYHYFPGSLLCFRKFWRSQRKDEVNYFPWLKNLIFSSLAIEKREVLIFFFLSGTLPNQSIVPSLCISIHIRKALRFWRIPGV